MPISITSHIFITVLVNVDIVRANKTELIIIMNNKKTNVEYPNDFDFRYVSMIHSPKHKEGFLRPTQQTNFPTYYKNNRRFIKVTKQKNYDHVLN
jgi:hypothetical protein